MPRSSSLSSHVSFFRSQLGREEGGRREGFNIAIERTKEYSFENDATCTIYENKRIVALGLTCKFGTYPMNSPKSRVLAWYMVPEGEDTCSDSEV